MESITTSTTRIWLDDEGILHVAAIGVASTAESSGETLQAVQELLDGRRAPILFDIRQWPLADPSFWVPFTRTLDGVCLAGGVVVKPEDAAKIGSFPSLINSLLIPFRVFSDVEEALAYLRLHT